MMYYIKSNQHDATYNLALEQYVFDQLDRQHSYLMLWQNANAVIIGKHQNTVEELDASFVDKHAIQVVRRLSGGGAVYHDMGNINFTFISNMEGESFAFSAFCQPVIDVLRKMGVNAQVSGRNDMTIDGMKFSGNSQYMKQGRIMHHGTIMYDSDLGTLAQALTVAPDKIQSKGFKSVRSRVTNVRQHVPDDHDVSYFLRFLESELLAQFDAQPLAWDERQEQQVRALQREVYQSWEWNYGQSPDWNIRKTRRFEHVGHIELRMDVSGGKIRDIAFFGDFFAQKDHDALIAALRGATLTQVGLRSALSSVDVNDYFHHLHPEDLLSLLLF